MHEDRFVKASDLVLIRDIADRTGMNPTKLLNAASSRRNETGFPCPVTGHGSRGIWLWPEVEEWWGRMCTKTSFVNPKPSTVRRQRRYQN
jgi:hypothetical protein